MDEFLEAVRQSAALSPKARREALRPYATRANISGAVLRLLAGRDQRALLRALCDLAAGKEAAALIAHNLLLQRERVEALLAGSDDAKVRKTLAQLLGRAAANDFADALIRALAGEKTLFVLPSVILALGNAKNTSAAAEALRGFAVPAGEEKQRAEIAAALQKALDAQTPAMESAPLRNGGALPAGTWLALRCPNARVTRRELASLGFSAAAPDFPEDLVYVKNAARFGDVFAARSFFDAALLLGRYETLAAAEAAVASRETTGLVRKLYGTDELPYRIETASLGDPLSRQQRREIAARLSGQLTRVSALRNSPSGYTLEFRLLIGFHKVLVLLAPSGGDTRFSYRKESISASAHPAVAAACVQAALPHLRADADVLDCFCGSGTMLFERARQPYRSLTGTDISHEALKAARANERAARTGAHFLIKNAVTPFEKRYDEVICNMPFGLRVSSHAQNCELYARFLENLPDILKEDGRAFLFTHEKKLLRGLLGNRLKLIGQERFAAGGLYPALFILKK